jgi:hypothetical protein
VIVAVNSAENVLSLAVADHRRKIVERARLSHRQFERWFCNCAVQQVVVGSLDSHDGGETFGEGGGREPSRRRFPFPRLPRPRAHEGREPRVEQLVAACAGSGRDRAAANGGDARLDYNFVRSTVAWIDTG